MVDAHRLAISKASDIRFDQFIISATTPFHRSDAEQLGIDAPSVLQRYVPKYVDEYASRDWQMFQSIRRVYDNSPARNVLGWAPKHDFEFAINRLTEGQDFRSELAQAVGTKGYHDGVFEDAPYPLATL